MPLVYGYLKKLQQLQLSEQSSSDNTVSSAGPVVVLSLRFALHQLN